MNKEKTPVISLVGYSGSGKSTVARAVWGILGNKGYQVDIIKKDDAIHELGGTAGEASTRDYARGSRMGSKLEGLLNQWLAASIEENDMVFLEGGTRTEQARQTTLSGLETKTDLTIVTFEASALTLARRLRQRRHEESRPDDTVLMTAGKLLGQFMKTALHPIGPSEAYDLRTVDANAGLPAVIGQVEAIALEKLQ